MSDSSSNSTSGGVSVSGLLGVAFVVLKLTGHINWPWVWVLAPFWIPLAIALTLLAFAGIFFLIAYILEQK